MNPSYEAGFLVVGTGFLVDTGFLVVDAGFLVVDAGFLVDTGFLVVDAEK